MHVGRRRSDMCRVDKWDGSRVQTVEKIDLVHQKKITTTYIFIFFFQFLMQTCHDNVLSFLAAFLSRGTGFSYIHTRVRILAWFTVVYWTAIKCSLITAPQELVIFRSLFSSPLSSLSSSIFSSTTLLFSSSHHHLRLLSSFSAHDFLTKKTKQWKSG